MLIGVTSFFLDARAFELLRSELGRYILTTKDKIIRIWSVDCGTGEEPYSIAITYRRHPRRQNRRLENVIKELETSNEKMQSMNEELQSSNEELQSSNEELETTNEELQSTPCSYLRS
ncbi:MAG: hypothetical protein ACI9BO_001390 [Zhongshania sp.]|jgi:hypothetical protein